MRFDGKVAILTGGTSGIGLATAQLFVEEGASVVLMARNPTRGRDAVEQITSADGQAIFVQGDVSVAADCQHCVTVAIETYGRLDILFNNAGVIYVNRNLVDTSEEEWDATLNSNLKSIFWMSKYAIPHIAKNGGSIINNASIFGLVGGGGVAAYCAAKGGVINLTRAMAIDHATQKIRVNCVCPGSVDTPLLENEMNDLGGVEVQFPKFASRHPMNRIAAPEEIARAVAYLASDDASFVTGVALPVDGGRSAW
ncbi:meso-butanediol dehydrogenase / (S,S)-butanediol dehydrogenase / diacetyl reductase [Anaerolineales bacterium]|nr:meso-butanediol dehydrogenase / (S,S)-butanediol dehydrogenase / diacetyl reductase [Anaerolineales bacterium]